MRLSALLVTAILTAAPAAAQQAQSSPAAPPASPAQDAAPTDAQSLNLPVSLAKIREALEQPAAPLKGLEAVSAVSVNGALKGLDQRALFRVEIQERQRFEDLIASLKFDSGPAVPGGLYGYEQQQVLFPKVNHPLAQPYAAFSQGELLQVAITTLVTKYLGGRLMSAVTAAERARAEEAARADVQRAWAEYWAARGQPAPPLTIPRP